MKKIMIAAIMLLSVSTLSYAQTNRAGNGTCKTSSGYTDINKNNVCDRFENGSQQRSGQAQMRKNGNNRGQCGNANQGRRNKGGRRNGC